MAYSYQRFSTAAQSGGDSLRRQQSLAEDYCKSHGLTLDDTLDLTDAGVSAFLGKNATDAGKLGAFLRMVQDGAVPRGSVLLIESFDRLSRQHAREASALLSLINAADVDVVTLNDGRKYTKDDDQMEWLIGCLMMIRGHEESATKAKRVRAAWEEKKATARKGVILTSSCPPWLVPTVRRKQGQKGNLPGGFRIVPDKGAVVKRIFTLYTSGVGPDTIAKTLNTEGVPTLSGRGKWARGVVVRTIDSKATLGYLVRQSRVPKTGGAQRVPAGEPIAGYYPTVVSERLWLEAQSLRRLGDVPVGDRKTLKNVLSKFGKCSRCGASLLRVARKVVASGEYSYLVCSAAKVGAGCPWATVRMDHIEQALRDQLVPALLSRPSGNKKREQALTRLRDKLDAAESQARHLAEELSLRPANARALREALGVVEQERTTLEKALVDLEALDPVHTGLNIQRLLRALPKEAAPGLNAALRRVFKTAVLDAQRGIVLLTWAHAPESAPVEVLVTLEAHGFQREKGRMRVVRHPGPDPYLDRD